MLYVEKGPGRGNYFVTDRPFPYGTVLGQAFTLSGARRKARRLLRRGIPERKYTVVEEVR